MTTKEQIADLAHRVGRALETYIQVHSRIFQEASTLRSLVKNLLGRGVPMPVLLSESQALIRMWASVRQEVDWCRARVDGARMPNERRYLDLLAEYVRALERTAEALVVRQKLLAEGSSGGRNNPMTWEAFRTAERRYEGAINEYKAVGLQLNNASPLIFG